MRMRLFACVVLAAACAAALFGMGARKRAQEAGAEVSVTGLVTVKGSEPHTWISFTAQDGTEYALSAADDTASELRRAQGVLLEISGTLEAEPTKRSPEAAGTGRPYGGTIRVRDFSAVDSD